MECFGGKASNCNVIDVVKAKVPSLPQRIFERLIVFEFPPNSSKFKRESTA